MTTFQSGLWFILMNLAMWVVMVVILIIVPDTLERWMSLELARGVGWAVACALWTLAVEWQWRRRTGPIVRFFVQTTIWVSAALVAIWISDQANMR